jgi:hypothetical protein
VGIQVHLSRSRDARAVGFNHTFADGFAFVVEIENVPRALVVNSATLAGIRRMIQAKTASRRINDWVVICSRSVELNDQRKAA